MRCPACGEENPERAKFCLECGSGLVATEPQESHESRRTVTIVFADMVGFTSLGESLDQESLRRVMDRFYAEMRAAIDAEGGTLAKFIGDAVLAVWGTPEVREDDALRAVRAADAMRRALDGLNEDLQARWGVRVGMRTGVNTGEVVVDPTRPADLLVGDALNVAARLEQAAADGEVLVGPDTFRLVRDHVVLEPIEPLALKGKARPLPAWRVVDARTGERRADPRLQAPLLGRDVELAALRAALDETVAANACRMFTVIGSPGLGKTRLVAEFVASLGEDATILQGRCQATGEGITFQPVAEVLRNAAGITDEDAPEVARAKLAAVIPDDEPDRDRIVERTASLLGLAPVASTEETFWAVRRLLESLARERPVVLVHDDIHWGQPTFLDLLEHFTEWIRDVPVFVLALARPELREVRPAFAEGALALEPLDAAASSAMVSALLGAADLPAGLAQRVLETTEGNPLFLGETLRMLADEGVLRREGDTWVAGDVSEVTVPPTINALLSARIERLGSEERSVVERAAVIGHSFYRGAVTELAPPSVRPGVDGALVTLGQKELVRPEDEWWLDEQVFRFHHVLIRDAAYRSLLKEARAELHERFADWLEAKAGELAGEHEEVIAFHLEQAHAYRVELGPLDEPGRALATRAGRRLHSAGCRALAREDLPAAANLLRRALVPLEGDLPGRVGVLVDLAETMVSAGDTSAAEEVVEALGLGADELRDERLRARAVVFAAQLDNLTGAGQVRETADAAAGAAETLARLGDRAGEAKAHQVVAQSEALLGQVAAAEAALDRALVAARAADDRRRVTAVLSGAPRAALWGPAPIVRASGRCLDVVRILRMTPGNRHVEAAALRSQAVLEAMRGRAEAARGILDTCRMTLEELGLTLELHETAVHAGIVELLAGDAVAAETRLRGAHEGFRALGVESGAAQAAALLARALLDQGRDDEALEATRFAEAHGGEDLKTTAGWLGVRAELLARRGEHDEARALAARAVELTEPTDALADRADSLMALAAVEMAAGEEPAARTAASAACELYRAKDHSVGVARAEVLAGASAPAQGEVPAVADRTAGGGPAARALRGIERCLNEQDWEGLHALYGGEEFRWVDHRSAGFFDEHGAAELDGPGAVRSTSTIPQGSVWTFELLAEGGAVAAGLMSSRGTGRKAGPWEVVAGMVCVCRGEEPVLVEALEDDREAILERFTELSGGESPAAWRWRAYFSALETRDFGAMADTFAADFLMVDTRQLAWAPWSRDDLIANNRSAADLDPDFRLTKEIVADEGDVFAVIMRYSGQTQEGVTFEIPIGVIDVGRELAFYAEVWDPDDREAMLRRVEELRPLAVTATSGRSPEVMWARYLGGHNRRDWEAMRSLLSEEYVRQDHRPVGWDPVRGPDELLAAIRSPITTAPDIEMVVHEVLARDDRTIALAVSFQAPDSADAGAFAISVAYVTRFDDEGRFLRSDIYDAADRDRILARFAEHGGGHSSPAARLAQASADAFNDRDWEGARALLAPGYVTDDRRAVGVGLVDAATAVDSLRVIAEVSPDARWRLVEHLGESGPAALFRVRFEGHNETGGTFDYETLMLFVAGGAGLVRRVIFEPDHLDEAQAELRSRAVAPAGVEALSPVARMYREVQRGFNECNWTAHERVLRDDYRWTDFRPGLRVETTTREEFIAVLRGMREGTDLRWNQASLEERAAGLVGMAKIVQTGTYRGGAYEVPFLVINAVDEDGRSFFAEMFAEDDPRAWTRLEELGLHHGLSARIRDAVNDRDLDALRFLVAEDFRQDDHRSLGADPITSLAGYVAMQAALVEAVPDMRVRMDVMDVDGPRRLSRQRWAGHSREGGGPLEVELWSVSTVAGGLNACSELFDAEEQARAVFAATAEEAQAAIAEGDPAAGARSEEAPVAAAYDALVAAFNARDWERLAGLNHPDFRLHDRRPLLRGETLDHDAMVANFVETVGDGDLRWSVVGRMAAGDRAEIVLIRWSGTARGAPFEVELLDLHALASDGRLVCSYSFAPEQEDEARALWADLSIACELEAALTAGDTEALSALVTEDYREIDRRSLASPPVESREAWLQVMDGVHDAMTNLVARVELVDVLENRARLLRVAYRARWREGGGEAAIEFWACNLLRGGIGCSSELFDSEEEALARFAALATETDTTAGEPPVLAYLRRAEEAFNRRDWGALKAMTAEEMVNHDHRPFGAGIQGPDSGQLHAVVETIPDARWSNEVIELLGPDRALARLWMRGSSADGGPAEVEVVRIVDVDSRGRLTHVQLFDDEAAARAWLADLAGADAPDWAAHEALMHRLEKALNARDRDALEELFAPEFQQEDRRPLGAPPLEGREAYLDMVDSLAATAPGLRVALHLVDVAGPLRVIRFQWAGTTEDGGQAEVVFWSTGQVRDGRLVHSALHASEEDALGELRARAAYGTERPPAGPSAGETIALWVDRFTARDWEGLRALYEPDAVRADRRPIGWDELRGREAIVAFVRAMAETRPDTVANGELVAERHEENRHVAVTRWSFAGDGWEIAFSALTITGAAGLIHNQEIFADDTGALAALAEWGAPPSPVDGG